MENNRKVIVEAQDLKYVYRDGTEALKSINLKIYEGEKLAIMGANGSGKSTFFLNLNGINKPTSGRIIVDGEPIEYDRKGLIRVRKNVGIVFQDPDNQLFSADVKQEISFGPFNLGWSEEEVAKKVENVIEELNISDYSHKPTHFLSGGQKKRVAVADVLVMEPKIIILDEPASGLDPKHINIIDEIIEKLSEKGITVIIATHDVSRALKWADRVVLFRKGEIIANGDPIEIFRNDKVLQETNLEKPPVLEMFDNLVEVGILADNGNPPKSMEELERKIKEIKVK